MEAKKTYQTVSEYIKSYPVNVQKILENLRKTIKEVVPQAQEIISYQIPAYKLNGKNLVHFAAYKNHIGFYPIPSAIKTFEKELSPWPSAKGSVRFPLDNPPLELIQKIVKFRVEAVLK